MAAWCRGQLTVDGQCTTRKTHDFPFAMISVVNEDFIFSQDFPTIAMNYFDRFLSRSEFQPTSKQEVELLALTCYYLAVKILRVGPIFSIDQMSLISGGVFSTTQIAAMEKQVLFTLDWNLYPPCATDFLRPYFMALLGDKNVPADLCRPEVVDLALKMLNAATLDYFFIAHQLSPSHLAAAALLDAMRFFLPICISTPTVQDIVRVLALHTGCHLNEHQVFVCCERFWGIIETINHGNYWSPTTASPLSDFSWSNHFCGNSSPPGAMAVAIPQQSPSSIIGLSNYLILSKQQDVTFEQEGPCTVPWLQ